MEQQSISEQFSHYFKAKNLLNAHSELTKKIKANQSFTKALIQFISAQHTAQHFNVLTIMHPVIVQVFPQLSKQLQQEIRNGLLTAVVQLHTDLKCMAALGLLIRQILQIDGAQAWMQPFSELLSWISSDDIAVMEAGVQFFIYLLKQTAYTSSNTELPLYKISHPLLEVLFQIFAQSQLTQKIRQKLLFLVLQIIKTFSIYDGSKDQIVKQCFDGTYEIWMSLFISALQSSLHLHLTIKKYIMKNLIIIFRDMPKYSQKSLDQYLGTVWEFTYKMIPVYLHTVAWNRPLHKYPGLQITQSPKLPNLYFDQDQQSILSPVQSLAHCCIQFISVIASTPQLHNITRISIHHLTNALFHYLLFTNNDLSQWETNPSHFITYGSMIETSDLGVRSKVIPVINQLIQKFGDLALQAILLICQKFLMNHSEQNTTEIINSFFQTLSVESEIPENYKGKVQSLIKLSSCDVRSTLKVSGQSWRKIQVALSILARFAQDIIVFQSKQQASFDIQSFVKGLINQIKDEQYFPLLKGQSMYCLTRFTEIISIKYRNLFKQLLAISTYCILPNMPLPVKIVGCKAFITFNRKVEKHKLKLEESQIKTLIKNEPALNISSIQLQTQTVNSIMQALVQLSKLSTALAKQQEQSIIQNKLNMNVDPTYLLQVFHKYSTHQSTMQLFFTLLNTLCSSSLQTYTQIFNVFTQFINQCLKAFVNVIRSQQKKYLKTMDTDLIIQVLKMSNVLITKSQVQDKVSQKIHQSLIKNTFPILCQIISINDEIQIHIATTVCIKNLIRASNKTFKQNDCNDKIVQVIRNLLKIPTDKTFQAAALYAGNLSILAQTLILSKTNYQILQEAVLKVFKSRTPSVIQSLILIYSRMINMKTNKQNIYNLSVWKDQVTDIIDFLASFSIQNRMGLKILIDKWLLQQSLFRGKYTKISTFMALSKLFLLRDKRVENLLVIGFNPSHTQVCNDVNAPLKILATLIRCLQNEMGGKNFDEQDQDQQGMGAIKQESDKLQVDLQKFKQEQPANQGQGGLADRQNQQGSTCYMSAMLEFYDDGQQCDETTEQDLLFLKDSSVQFELKDYLLQFFNYLNDSHQQYFKQCLKGLLKSDIKSLQKFINISI